MADKEKVIVEGETVYILQPGMTVYVKTADICSLFGISNQWAGQLTSQGTLNKMQTDHGKLFNLGDSVHAYMDSLNDKVNKTAEERKMEKAKAAAEVKLKVAKAAMAELQAKELSGKMHRSEDVQIFTQELIETVKNALLSMPGRLAVEVSLCDTAEECSALIKDAVRDVLNELSEYDYDPEKYEALVRERNSMDEKPEEDVEE
jgi:phage terminase Nu1 subunit (DNA packaging protein)